MSVGSAAGSGKGGDPSGASSGMDNITVGVGGGAPTCVGGMTDDMDMDGFTPAQGDCNDCDPNINPDAIDTPSSVDPDGGMVPASDNNCDGKVVTDVTCDDNLPLGDIDPYDGAKAVEFCQKTAVGQGWGLIEAKYVSADGNTPRMPGLQAGLISKFGTNVAPQIGKTMLGLSSGHMRTPGQPGYCIDPVTKNPSQSCVTANDGPPPAGFPQNVMGCTPKADIHDDIALEVTLRAPTNATGYQFNFKFYSFEYPEWVCSDFNDQFVALVNPPPMGSIKGNVSFDTFSNPVSVNVAFFDVCDPATKGTFSQKGCGGCKTPPNPYCPKGLKELIGTGMEGKASDPGDGGATSWLVTTAPIKGKQEFTIRFAIWDTGDHNLDSHVLIDAFKWIATPGVVVSTKPPA